MNCDCNLHRVTGLTQTATNVQMTVTNSTNISNLDRFDLVLCVNPSTVVTGGPLAFSINVNGAEVPLRNKYGLPISSDRLNMRKRYCGAYVNDGTNAWVVLFNTPCCAAYA